jgi:hypothetical protein
MPTSVLLGSMAENASHASRHPSSFRGNFESGPLPPWRSQIPKKARP